MSSLLSLFKLFYLLLDRVERELSQEHLFLLVDELIGVLFALFLGELYTTTSKVHGLMDFFSLLR